MMVCFFCSNACFKVLILLWRVKPWETAAMCFGKQCCDGYIWNTQKRSCEKCMPGYSGPNCTIPCPYPTYGDNCQGYCDCSNDRCHLSTGCIIFAEYTTQEFFSWNDFKQATTDYLTSAKFRLTTKVRNFNSDTSGINKI